MSSTTYVYNGQFYQLQPGEGLFELPGGMVMVQPCPCIACDSLRMQQQAMSGWYLPNTPPQAYPPQEEEEKQLELPFEKDEKWYKLKASHGEFRVISMSGSKVTIRKRNERESTEHEMSDIEAASDWKRS